VALEAMCCQTLGMSVAEFWELDYERYYARLDRWEAQEYRWDLRFGTIASAYLNSKQKEGATPVSAGAWFGYADPEDPEEDYEMSVEDTVAFLKQKCRPPV